MEYREEDLKKLKENILLIINEVKKICDAECIQYFIIGGSALGAVRHGGFIPWDDDFDVGMTRENYDRFLEVAPQKLSPAFFLQCYKTDSATPFYFTKVRINNTKFVESYCQEIDMNHGIFIDVFPYDNIPQSSFKRKCQLIKVIILSELYIAKSTNRIFSNRTNKISFHLKNSSRKILHCLLHLVPKKYLFRVLDNENQRYNKCHTVMASYVRYPFLAISKKNIELCDSILFENIPVSCSKNIEEYLYSHFGEDYMQLPPIDKRVNHKPIELLFNKISNK